jgi:hypothetical protein
MRAIALVELGRQALHPSQDGGVLNADLAFSHQFLDITIASGIAEIPPHTADDDLPSTVAPFEERGLVHVWPPVI